MMPGPLELFVRYENDTSADNGFVPQFQLTARRPMRAAGEGWQRWEAPMPTHPQLRYRKSCYLQPCTRYCTVCMERYYM